MWYSKVSPIYHIVSSAQANINQVIWSKIYIFFTYIKMVEVRTIDQDTQPVGTVIQ